MPKSWSVGFLFLLFLPAQQAHSDSDDYNLVKYSEVIVRGRLHYQTKIMKYPNAREEYPVPFRLEITQVFKETVQEPKEIEITDNYWDMCHTDDSLALTKKFQALDGKDVMAFLIRIPPGRDLKYFNKKGSAWSSPEKMGTWDECRIHRSGLESMTFPTRSTRPITLNRLRIR